MEEHQTLCCLFKCCVRECLHDDLADGMDHVMEHGQHMIDHVIDEGGQHAAHHVGQEAADHAAHATHDAAHAAVKEVHVAAHEVAKESAEMFDKLYPMDKWEKALQQIESGQIPDITAEVLISAGAFVIGKEAMDAVAPGLEKALKLIGNAKKLEEDLASFETSLEKGVIPDGKLLRDLGMEQTAKLVDNLSNAQKAVEDAVQGKVSDAAPELLKALGVEKTAKLAENLNKAMQVEQKLAIDAGDVGELLRGVGVEGELEDGSLDVAGEFLHNVGFETMAKVVKNAQKTNR